MVVSNTDLFGLVYSPRTAPLALTPALAVVSVTARPQLPSLSPVTLRVVSVPVSLESMDLTANSVHPDSGIMDRTDARVSEFVANTFI